MSEEKTIVLSKEDLEAIKKGSEEGSQSEEEDDTEAKKNKDN